MEIRLLPDEPTTKENTMAQPGDEYVLTWIRDKQDAKKEAESRGLAGIKPDFEVNFLLRLLDEANAVIDSIEARYDV